MSSILISSSYKVFAILQGFRLNVEPMENIHAKSGAECAQKYAEKSGCRSVNFRNLQSCGEIKNCELLSEVDSETLPGYITKDEVYDYYVLLNKVRMHRFYHVFTITCISCIWREKCETYSSIFAQMYRYIS